MNAKKEIIITTDRNIGIFFDTTWEHSGLNTVLYEGDNPVGQIAAWEKDGDNHVVHVCQGNTKVRKVLGAGNMRFRNVLFMGTWELAVDVVAA